MIFRDELMRKETEVERLREARESDGMALSLLEDRLRDLTFTLHQTQSELKSTQTLSEVRREGHEREAEDLKSKCEVLRLELSESIEKFETISEERNGSRLKEAETDRVLKLAMEQLLSSKCSEGSEDAQENIAENQCLICKDLWLTLGDLVATRARPAGGLISSMSPTSTAGKNLSNLQSCLNTLKGEMALLQRRLAPQQHQQSNELKSQQSTRASSLATLPDSSPHLVTSSDDI